MVEFGSELAKKNGFTNLTYKLGDIEEVPLKSEKFDLVLLSQALHHAQHPEKAFAEAHRILKPGGQVLILDLLEHQFDKARELYADVWLGFSENTLYQYMKVAGFRQIDVNVVAKEESPPHFQTVLASGYRD